MRNIITPTLFKKNLTPSKPENYFQTTHTTTPNHSNPYKSPKHQQKINPIVQRTSGSRKNKGDKKI